MAVPVTVIIVVAVCVVLNVTPGESQEFPKSKKRFYIDTSKGVNWHTALFQCMKNNSALASPESAEEFQEMISLIEKSGASNAHFWLGGNDLAKEGTWLWSEGQEMGGFNNWGTSEPSASNENEDCLEMRPKSLDHKWNDHSCFYEFSYICEYRTAITADWPPPGGEKKFYLQLGLKVDWHSAYMYCLRNNSRLARIENKAENDIVVSMIKEANLGFEVEYWLGATDFPEVGLYFWLATGTPVRGYSNWHAGQGMGEDQRCLTYWQSSQHVVRWNDFICTTLYPFVCEYYE